MEYTIMCFFIKACSCLEILLPCLSKVSQVLSSKNRFKHLHLLGGCFPLYVKIRILNRRHTGNLIRCNFLLMVGSGKPQSSGSVSLRHKNKNNQTSESQKSLMSQAVTTHGWTTNLRRWKSTNPLKQEAGKDNCPEMNSRCVACMMGENWETAPLSLEIEKVGKD